MFIFLPWKRHIIETCQVMYEYPKHLFTSNVLKNAYLSHLFHHRSSLILCTYASKTREWVGYAVTDFNTSITGKIHSHCSIHTAELHAKLSAINYSKNSMDNRLVMMTDSESATQSIKMIHSSEPLVQSVFREINVFFEKCNLTLGSQSYWCTKEWKNWRACKDSSY